MLGHVSEVDSYCRALQIVKLFCVHLRIFDIIFVAIDFLSPLSLEDF